jgi:hypothetical protein
VTNFIFKIFFFKNEDGISILASIFYVSRFKLQDFDPNYFTYMYIRQQHVPILYTLHKFFGIQLNTLEFSKRRSTHVRRQDDCGGVARASLGAYGSSDTPSFGKVNAGPAGLEDE